MSVNGSRIAVGPGPYLMEVQQMDDARTGAVSRVVWRGSLEEVNLQRSHGQALGPSNVDVKSDGTGDFTLTMTFPFAFDGLQTDFGFVPSIHELETNVANRPFQKNRVLLDTFDDDLGKIAKIHQVAQWFRSGLYVDADGYPDTEGAEAAITGYAGSPPPKVQPGLYPGDDDALALFRLLAYNQTEYFTDYTHVYRKTMTCATPAQLKASRVGAGQIWTTQEILDVEQVPVDNFFDLPLDSLWIKSKPTVLASAGQKTQVVYSYTEVGKPSRLLYNAHGAAQLA